MGPAGESPDEVKRLHYVEKASAERDKVKAEREAAKAAERDAVQMKKPGRKPCKNCGRPFHPLIGCYHCNPTSKGRQKPPGGPPKSRDI